MSKRLSAPRGARLFEEPGPAAAPRAGHYTANIDGAARGNPGPASYGVLLRDPAGAVAASLKKYIGHNTNNVAEYYALIAALDYATTHNIRALRVYSDSELLVKQMRGQYKVKSPDLRPLFEHAKKMSQSLESFVIEHVFRERNREADALANQALDETAPAANSSPAKSETRSPKVEPRVVRAVFRDGALRPLGPHGLAEGDQVELTIRRPLLKGL